MSYKLVFDHDKLTEVCDEINPIDAKFIITGLRSKLAANKDLIALSAPQIGESKRIIAIKFRDNNIKVFINPIILKTENFHLVREKDVTYKDVEFISPRPNKILIRYQDETAKPEENILEGPVAEVFDRMNNYLDGVPLSDYGLEVSEDYDNASDDEKDEIISMYLDSLRHRGELLQKSINDDPDAKQLEDALRFIESVEKGETILGDKNLLISKDNESSI